MSTDLETAIRAHTVNMPNSKVFTWISDDGTSENESLTWSDLLRESERVASLLEHNGLCKTRVILMFQPGDLWFVKAFYGCVFSGAVAVPVYPPDPSRANKTLPRIEAIVSDCDPTAIITTSDVAELISLTRDDLPAQLAAIRVIAIDTDWTPARAWTPAEHAPSDVALVQYTSGSTDKPKGAVITRDSIAFNCRIISKKLETSPGTNVAAWLPLFHDMGLIGYVCHAPWAGAHSWLMQPLAFIKDPSSWFRLVSVSRAEVTSAPNFAYELCLRKVSVDSVRTADLSSLRIVCNAAEPIRLESVEAFETKFACLGLKPGVVTSLYGLAEATLYVCGEPSGKFRKARSPNGTSCGSSFASCGRPSLFPEVGIKVVSPDGRAVMADGCVGEVWVSGRGIASGYLKRGSDSGVFGARLPGGGDDGTAYLKTGDLGFMLEGDLYITGRMKDVIIVRGENRYPQDIEVAAETVPGVRPGCSVAHGGGMCGADSEAVCAIVELRSGSSDDPATVAARVKSAVAESSGISLSRVCVVAQGSSHKTSSGKIQRRSTVAALASGEIRPLAVLQERDQPVADPQHRAAMRPPVSHGAAPPRLRLPLSRAEAEVAAAWESEVSPRPSSVEQHTSFFEIGGDSISAAGVAFALGVPVRCVYEHPVLSDLAAAIGDARGSDAPRAADRSGDQIERASPQKCGISDGVYPVCGQQEAVLLAQCGDRSDTSPLSSTYFERVVVVARPAIGAESMAAAFWATCERHQILRTSYSVFPGASGCGVTAFAQTVHGAAERCKWARFAWCTADDPKERAIAMCRDSELAAFSGVAPVSASFAVSSDGSSCALCIGANHASCDGFSLRVALEELSAELALRSPGGRVADRRTPPLGAADYAVWQRSWIGRSAVAQRQLEYWKGELSRAAAGPELCFVSDHRTRHGVPESEARVLSVPIPGDVRGDVSLARRRLLGGTRSELPLLLSAYAIAVSRLCRCYPDVTVGVAHSSRTPETARSLGCFVNVLPVRISVDGNLGAREFVEAVAAKVDECCANSGVPVALADCLARSGGCQTAFSWHSFASHVAKIGPSDVTECEIVTRRTELTRAAKYVLSAFVSRRRDGAALVEFEYDSAVLSESTVSSFAGGFFEALRGVSRAVSGGSDSRVREVQLLPEVMASVANFGDFSASSSAVEGALHSMFERACDASPPDAIAVDASAVARAGERSRFTYSELDEEAERVAESIGRDRLIPGEVVAIDVRCGFLEYSSAIGVMKCGGSHMFVSRRDTDERTMRVLATAGCTNVVTDDPGRSSAYSGRGKRVVLVGDAVAGSGCGGGGKKAGGDVGRGTRVRGKCEWRGIAAYAVCTSGTTGTPKVVLVSHTSAATFVTAWAKGRGYTARSRSLASMSNTFDAWVINAYCALCFGGTVVVPSEESLADVVALDRAIAQRGVTHTIVPTVMANMLLSGQAARGGKYSLPGHVEMLAFGGEEAPGRIGAAAVESLGTRAGKLPSPIVNAYGPTECTVAATWHDVGSSTLDASEDARLPIGVPLPTHSVRITDSHGNVLPPGFPGELHIGGPCLAIGYAGDARATEAAFVERTDRFAGDRPARFYRTGDVARWRRGWESIEYLGRTDTQTKVRGKRIDVSEIESAAARVPGVTGSAVVILSGSSGKIVCFVSSVAGSHAESVSTSVVRECSETLHWYAIPDRIVVVDALPLTPHGKVDRRRLSDMATEGDASALSSQAHSTSAQSRGAPSPGALAMIAAASAVLGRQVCEGDSFFESGGNSILVFGLIREAERLGWVVSHRDVYRSKTFGDLGSVAVRASHHGDPGPVSPAGKSSSGTPSLGSDRRAVGMSRSQAMYFRMSPDGSRAACHAAEIEIDGVHGRDAISAAFDAVVSAHPELGVLFRRDGATGEWSQCAAWRRDEGLSAVVTTAGPCRDLTSAAEAMASDLDISRGPLVRAHVCTRTDCAVAGDGTASPGTTVVLVVAHHLVVDGESWRIIASSLSDAANGRRVAPEKMGFADWAALSTGAASGCTERAAVRPTYSECDHADVCVRIRRSGTVGCERRMRDAMSSAVSRLARIAWGNGCVDVECHGRSDPALSDTVGFFTTIERRHGTPVERDRAAVASSNFHGVLGHVRGAAVRPVGCGLVFDPSLRMLYMLEANAWECGDALRVCVRCGNNPASLDARSVASAIADAIEFAASNVVDVVPATSNQVLLLNAIDVAGDSGKCAYSVNACVTLAPLAGRDRADLAASLVDSCVWVISRHDALRSSFRRARHDSGCPYVQVVFHLSCDDVARTVTDASGHGVRDAAAAAAAATRACTVATAIVDPFSGTAPLTRFAVAVATDGSAAVAVSTNHALVDAESMRIIFEEIAAGRRQCEDAPTAWHIREAETDREAWCSRGSPEARAALDFWNSPAHGAPPDVLGSNHSLASGSPEPVVTRVSVGGSRELMALSSACGCTPVAVLAFVCAEVLAVASPSPGDPITVWTAAHGRCEPGEVGAVGYLAEVLPIAVTPAVSAAGGRLSVADAVRRVHERIESAIAHSRVPVSMRKSRPAAAGNAFVSYDTRKLGTWSVQDRLGGEWRLHGGSDGDPGTLKFGMSFDFCDAGDGSLEFAFTHDGRRIPESIGRAISEAVRSAMEWLISPTEQTTGAAGVERPASDMRMCSDTTLEDATLSNSSEASAELHPSGPMTLDFDRVQATAGDAIAIVHGAREYTYYDVFVRAAAVANSVPIDHSGVVAVCMRNSPDYVWGMLGASIAGATFMPISPSLPADRVRVIVGLTGCTVAITDAATEATARSAFPPWVSIVVAPTVAPGAVLACREMRGKWDAAAVAKRQWCDATAYVMATSGSTGVPKLVAVSHASLLAETRAWMGWMNAGFPGTFAAGSRVMWCSSIAFDPSIQDIMCTLGSGATLVIPECEISDAAGLMDEARAHGVNHLPITPTMLSACVAARGCLPGCVSTVDCGGEELRRGRTLDAVGGCAVVDAYGPTETTITATAGIAKLPSPRGSRPAGADATCASIGRPIGSHSVFVLSPRSGRRLPVGFPGEVAIGGPCVSLGYVGMAAETLRRFVSVPGIGRVYLTGDAAVWLPDGTLGLLGRYDCQVKIRGQRVDPEEVSAAAVAVGRGAVSDAVAAATSNGSALVCFVKPATASAANLRAGIARLLPAYMVPVDVVASDSWPTTVGGKTDVRSLVASWELHRHAPDGGAAAAVHGRLDTQMEMEVAEAMMAVTGARAVHPDSDFFELGGDSIGAASVASRVSRRSSASNRVVRASDVAKLRTVRAIASFVESQRRLTALEEDDDPQNVPASRSCAAPLSGEQAQMMSLVAGARSRAEADAYSVRVVYAIYGDPLDVESLRAAVSAVSSEHGTMRTLYSEAAPGEFEQVTLPPGSRGALSLCVLDAGTVDPMVAVAIECARVHIDVMAKEAPVRAFCATSSDGLRSALGFVASHLCYDAESLDTVQRDVATAYAAAKSVASCRMDGDATAERLALAVASIRVTGRVQYADYARWQRRMIETGDTGFARQLEHWKGVTSRYASMAVTPRRVAAEPAGGAVCPSVERATLDALCSMKLSNACRQGKVSLFSAMLAAYSVAVNSVFAMASPSDWSEPVPIGVTLSGRNNIGPAAAGTVGYFVKTLPVALKPEDDLLRAALEASSRVVEAHENSAVPVTEVVSSMRRSASGAPFAALFSMEGSVTGSDFDLCDGTRCVAVDAAKVSADSGVPAPWSEARAAVFPISLVVTCNGADMAFEFHHGGEHSAHGREVVSEFMRVIHAAVAGDGNGPSLASAKTGAPGGRPATGLLSGPEPKSAESSRWRVAIGGGGGGAVASEAVPPSGTEAAVWAAWRSVLGDGIIAATEASGNCNFFQVGGDSLSAVLVAAELSRTVRGVGVLSASELVNRPTLSGMASVIDGLAESRSKKGLPTVVFVPGSYPQRLRAMRAALSDVADLYVVDTCAAAESCGSASGRSESEALSESISRQLGRVDVACVVGFCHGFGLAIELCSKMGYRGPIVAASPEFPVVRAKPADREEAERFAVFFRYCAATRGDPAFVSNEFCRRIGVVLTGDPTFHEIPVGDVESVVSGVLARGISECTRIASDVLWGGSGDGSRAVELTRSFALFSKSDRLLDGIPVRQPVHAHDVSLVVPRGEIDRVKTGEFGWVGNVARHSFSVNCTHWEIPDSAELIDHVLRIVGDHKRR